MVYQDISVQVEINKIGKTRATAQLLDRLFSFVIDHLVLSPFAMFVLYFTFNNGFIYSKANPLAPENGLFYTLMAICYITLFSLMQTFFVGIWNATPGQYFLKIKFDFNNSSSLNLLRIFCRQMAFWVSFLLLGIPFLSIMTNERRRTFYDQIADVTVLSLKEEKIFFDFENEFKYWRALVSTLSLFYIFLFGTYLWTNYQRVVYRVASFNDFYSRNYFCEEMTGIDLTKRLEVAVAMNLVDQLSDTCLDREADFILWKQKSNEYSLAYYAKSLTAETSEKEQSYLTQACMNQEQANDTEKTLGCKIAQGFKNNELNKLYTQLNEEGLLSSVLKYELSLILEKNENLSETFAKISEYDDLKFVKKYQIIELLNEDINLYHKNNRLPASTDGEIVLENGLGTYTPTEEDKKEKIMQMLGEL